MKIRTTFLIIFTLLLLTTGIIAQGGAGNKPASNRATVSDDDPLKDLNFTDSIHTENIEELSKNFNEFSGLVELARIDRNTKWKEENIDPLNFENTFRKIPFATRNTYFRSFEDIEKEVSIRKQKVSGNLILEGFGEPAKIKKEISKSVKLSQQAGNKSATDISYNQNRKGLELLQYDFIQERVKDAEKGTVTQNVGSKRRSLTLLYKKTGNEYKLDMMVTRLVHDNLLAGSKEVQVIIDPSPLTAGMDDLIIIDRYNRKPPRVSILGSVNNDVNAPYKLRFKQSFYSQHLSNFYRMFRLVQGFSEEDDSGYQYGMLKDLERSLKY